MADFHDPYTEDVAYTADMLPERTACDSPWVSVGIRPAVEREPVDDWQAKGACLGMDPDVFYPERGQSSRPAKRVCLDCPVWEQCLTFAMRDKHGVWGGLSERQRRSLRRVTPSKRMAKAVEMREKDRAEIAASDARERAERINRERKERRARLALNARKRETARARYAEDPELRATLNARHRNYYADNAEYVKAQERARYERNREQILAQKREYRARTREARNAWQRQYRAQLRERNRAALAEAAQRWDETRSDPTEVRW